MRKPKMTNEYKPPFHTGKPPFDMFIYDSNGNGIANVRFNGPANLVTYALNKTFSSKPKRKGKRK